MPRAGRPLHGSPRRNFIRAALIARPVASVSFSEAVAVGLGGIIGAGIFVMSGTMVSLAGVGALFAFIMTGLVAVIIAMEMGELSSAMPQETGASYSFVYNAFGSELGFITGILLYLSFAVSISAIALGFGTYLSSFLGWGGGTSYLLAALLIVALTSLNLRGVSEAAKADFFIVAFKVVVLIAFIVFALVAGTALSANLAQPPKDGISGVFSASVIAIFAYAGFQSIATMTPNIRGGGRTAAKAILVAVAISLVLYVLVTVSLLALVPASGYAFRADPLSFALASAAAPSWLFVLVNLAALAATASATLAMIIAGSALMSQLSKDGLLPGVLGRMRTKRGTDVPTLALTAVFGIVFMFLGDIYVIAAVSNFGILFSYLITGFALVKIRRMRRHPEKHKEALQAAGIPAQGIFEMPLFPFLPALGIAILIAFFFAFPPEALSIGIGLVLASLITYYALREDRDEPVIRIRFFR